MAAKNQVTLTFAGDSSKLETAFDKVGSSAKSMGDDVGRASRDISDSGDGFDRASGAADDAEGKFQGLASTLEGTTDTASGFAAIAKGDLYGGLIQVGQGGADLAEGLNYTVIPVMKKAVLGIKNWTVAQKALNLAMRLNPIGIIITALTLLVVGLVIAYKKSETFRNIVQGAMRGVVAAFGWIVRGFGAAWTAVSGAWNRFATWVGGWKESITRRVSALFSAIGSAFGTAWRVTGEAVGRFFGWVTGWPGAVARRVGSMFSSIGGAFGSAWRTTGEAVGRFFGWVSKWPGWISSRVGSMWNGVRDGFKGAINWIIDRWNNFQIKLGGKHIDLPFGQGFDIPSFTLDTPNIPRFHTGGTMPGAPGSEGLALLQAGERVTPAGRSGRVEVVLRLEGSGDLIELLRKSLRGKGLTVEGLTT